MQVSEAELRSMLAEAYERGWHGFMEGRDECVSEIVAALRSRSAPDPYAVTTTTVTSSHNPNTSDPHYFYYSATIPQAQFRAREEIV